MYNTDIMEYRMYPRMLAVSEIAWTPLDKKDYKDFERRINNAYVRLDGHDVNYHIPQPEQPNGSCNFVAFVDSTSFDIQNYVPKRWFTRWTVLTRHLCLLNTQNRLK